MTTALVTGASGFIGSHLIQRLVEHEVAVTALIRPARNAETARQFMTAGKLKLVTGDLTDPSSLHGVCGGVQTVFHLAGYAHTEDANDAHTARLHQRITVEGTRALLEESIRTGVKRFVFVSSIKAMGEGGADCLDENSPAGPTTAYGSAKLEAEKLVITAGREHGMHVAVLRLPLTYGAGNKGNIPRMIAAIDNRRFPPFPQVHNRRSMIHVDDVVQALLLAAETPAANGQLYIVTDGQVYSTREMYVAICRALGRRVPSWTVPAWSLRAAARLGDVLERVTKRRMPVNVSMLDKLMGSAWYNSEKIRRELGFVPRHNFFDALQDMVAEYRTGTRPPMASAG